MGDVGPAFLVMDNSYWLLIPSQTTSQALLSPPAAIVHAPGRRVRIAPWPVRPAALYSALLLSRML